MKAYTLGKNICNWFREWRFSVMEKKILDLLAKSGCNQELVAQIGESLSRYKTAVRESFEADYSAKVEQAKKLCIEETDKHKRDLCRRVQIFLETKSAVIDANLARQSALSESAAQSKLRNLKSLLEGVESNAQATNGPATAEFQQAKQQIRQLTEERDQAVAIANKQTAVAEKAIKRNRELATENAKLRTSPQRETVVEGRTNPPVRPQPKRIDEGRSKARPQTTRSTLVEHQVRNPQPQTGTVQSRGNGYRVEDIAGQMDEHL
jgi:hypothetical protein